MSRNGRLRQLLLGGVSLVSLDRAWAALSRRDGQAPAATVEAAAGSRVTVDNRNSRKRKAPARTEALTKGSCDVVDTRTYLRAQ
jgi:hypothetical protein